MNSLFLINCIYPILALIGMLLISHKRSSGFIVFIAVEFCMMYIGIKLEQYGILAMAIIYFFTNIYGYYQWKKN